MLSTRIIAMLLLGLLLMLLWRLIDRDGPKPPGAR